MEILCIQIMEISVTNLAIHQSQAFVGIKSENKTLFQVIEKIYFPYLFPIFGFQFAEKLVCIQLVKTEANSTRQEGG